MKDKLYSVMRKVRYNMPVVHMVNKLDKDILNSGSKYIIEIEEINIISNDIKESVIRNRYNKVYKI